MRGDVALATHMAILLGCCLIRFFDGDVERWRLLSNPLKTIFLHDSAIVLTTIAYRVSPFHPLYQFPGPLIYKVTSLRTAYIVYSGRRHLIMAGLHAKYGEYVRTGQFFYASNLLAETPKMRSQHVVHQLSCRSLSHLCQCCTNGQEPCLPVWRCEGQGIILYEEG